MQITGGSGEEDSTKAQHPVVADFRSIIHEQQKEQLNEVNDQRSRARNIIVHGVEEEVDANKTPFKKKEEEFTKKLLETMGINDLVFKSVHRIGKPHPEKKRPIMLMMNSEADKQRIMENLPKLKDKADFKGISITEDYTLVERQMLTEWREKAKTKNNEEEPNSKYVWRVRGTPKNGLMLKKLLKQAPAPRDL